MPEANWCNGYVAVLHTSEPPRPWFPPSPSAFSHTCLRTTLPSRDSFCLLPLSCKQCRWTVTAFCSRNTTNAFRKVRTAFRERYSFAGALTPHWLTLLVYRNRQRQRALYTWTDIEINSTVYLHLYRVGNKHTLDRLTNWPVKRRSQSTLYAGGQLM